MNLGNDMPVMSNEVPTILVRYTTPEERRVIAGWVRKAFGLDIDWHSDDVSEFLALSYSRTISAAMY